MMRILSGVKRFVRDSYVIIVGTLLVSPFFGRFTYWATRTEPLDPQETWNRFTKPKGRFTEWFMSIYPPQIIIRLVLALSYRRSFKFKDHAVGISEHYDLSPDFYGLFLDKKYRFYTGADFLKSTDTLEDAQENKANYLLNLIDPKPGEKIVEIACGWGGMLKKIYEKTGDKENLRGYTLSRDEKNFIDEKYGFHVELKDSITAQYEQESFDKIVAIGVFEHVREHELLPLVKKLSNALKPNGKLILHFFCQMEDIPPPRLRIAGYLVFPGSELVSLKRHLNIFDQANLRVTHHSIHDYRPTLKAWFDRLVANKEAAIQLVGVRDYNKYQCYFAEAWRLFDDRDLILMRFVLERQGG